MSLRPEYGCGPRSPVGEGPGAAQGFARAGSLTDSDRVVVCLSAAKRPGPEEQIAACDLDITDRKRAEEALSQANRKLNLLSDITRHDINNQLTVLMGYIKIPEKEQLAPAPTEYFEKVSSAATRISSVIQFTKEYKKIGVDDPTWQVIRTTAKTATAETPLGRLVVKNDLPARAEVFADPLVTKVFSNLMNNAAQYGGGITTIMISLEERDGDRLIVCEDDGDGIPNIEMERIFERGFGEEHRHGPVPLAGDPRDHRHPDRRDEGRGLFRDADSPGDVPVAPAADDLRVEGVLRPLPQLTDAIIIRHGNQDYYRGKNSGLILMQTIVTDLIYETYLGALLAGDRDRCVDIVQELNRADIALKDLYLNLFQRALYRTGELWEHHRISVSVEHLATAITERLLTLVEPQVFQGPLRDRSVIIACVADEYHQLGARMVADFFAFHGWRGYFLGANTPVKDLLDLIADRDPDLLALSLSIYSNLPSLLTALDAIRAEYPELPVLVGGQAFRWGGAGALEKYHNVTYVASIDELERLMEEYGDR